MSADDCAVCVRPDEPTYTDEDVRALAGVLETWLGERVLPEDAASLLDHLLAHGWAKRADVLEDVAIGVRDTINGAYPKEANEALLAVAEAIMEEAKDSRHSSAKATEDRP